MSALPPTISEADFQNLVIEYAKTRGWKVHAERAAMRQSGKWSTPIQGDRGFPDLVLAREGRIVLAELKSAKGKLSKFQQAWLDTLSTNHPANRLVEGRYEMFVWRPSDWEQIQRVLK